MCTVHYTPEVLSSFRTELQIPCAIAPSLRAQHTSSIEHIAAALAQERRAGRGTGCWCVGRGKAAAPEMGHFFWCVGDRFPNPKTSD